jgi:hypothetical protein
MRIPWVPLLALTAAAPAASALEVVHQPASCSTADAYLRIAARAVPVDGAASGVVRFRVDPRDAWYVVRMTPAGGDWTAALPRPQATLKRFQYQVVLTGADAQAATTEPATVEVRADCPLPGAAVADAIDVQVPPGAPVVPPVPAGFSPVGVTGPAIAKKSHRGLKVLGGVAVAGVGGGLAAAASSTEHAGPEVPDYPTFAFDGVFPEPGATLTPRDGLTLFVRMSHEPRRGVTVQWSVELLSATGVLCGNMIGRMTGVQRETRLALNAPLFIIPSRCGQSFDVDSLRLSVGRSQAGFESTQLPLKYRYEN